MKEQILDIENIRCGYGPHMVLEEINLTIQAGEWMGLIGPNGSGKTTLLRAITKIIPLRRGDIHFKGNSINDINHKDLAKRIAVVSQAHQDTFFKMTVEEIVTMGRIPHIGKYQFVVSKKDAARVKESMLMTDILHLREREMGCLSGGERQMVFLARALAQEPEFLLLDEPTTHLDITHQVRILDLIRRLNKKFGLTILTILHDLNLASEYCHRLILLNNGRIEKVGPPGEVMRYEILEEVYKTEVVVEKNPISSKPHVFVVSEKEKQKRKGGN